MTVENSTMDVLGEVSHSEFFEYPYYYMPSCVRLPGCQEHSLKRPYSLALSHLTAAVKAS
jgi:hypothetical protein